MRIIARMNYGGPALHVAVLSGGLERTRFETLLVSGRVAAHEASAHGLAQEHGASVVTVSSLGPELTPRSDARAFKALVTLMRRFRPDIVHTHTAKAGLLGRLAARFALGDRPLVVHTYHGHVLVDYFGPVKTMAFRSAERTLAHTSDVLVGVSEATVADLVGLGVASRSKFRVVRIGLPLDRFLGLARNPDSPIRRSLGVGGDEVLLVYVGRLVPIKRLDVLLEAMRVLRAREVGVTLAVAGGGSDAEKIRAGVRRLGLGRTVKFLGYRRELEGLLEAADIAVLASDSEGTPVSLIEAGAAGLPSVATAVGGVADVVTHESGLLVPRRRPTEFADAVQWLVERPAERSRRGALARRHVAEHFSDARLIGDVETLYQVALDARRDSHRRQRTAKRVHGV